jgi:serine/threonine-protein kinase
MPVPADAEIEWQDGLDCPDDGDCHLLVVQGDRLYEAYRARALGDDRLGTQCLAIWQLERVYPPEGRGEHCTSADAAGFPIAPLLFNADEVHAAMQVPDGDLGHAIRFILPNARMTSTTCARRATRAARRGRRRWSPTGRGCA